MRFVKELAPFTKFIIMLSIIGCAYSTDSVPAMAVFIVMQALEAMVSGAGRTYLTIFLALFAGAITLTLFQIFYIKDGNVVFTIIPPLDWGKVTDQGPTRAMSSQCV
jgi:hypothetical protein